MSFVEKIICLISHCFVLCFVGDAIANISAIDVKTIEYSTMMDQQFVHSAEP